MPVVYLLSQAVEGLTPNLSPISQARTSRLNGALVTRPSFFSLNYYYFFFFARPTHCQERVGAGKRNNLLGWPYRLDYTGTARMKIIVRKVMQTIKIFHYSQLSRKRTPSGTEKSVS